MLLYEKDLKSKNPIFPLKEEIIKLLFCSSLGKKKNPEVEHMFSKLPHHGFAQALWLWETSFLIDPCRSYSSVDISKAKRSLPSKCSEYTNEAFHICEN